MGEAWGGSDFHTRDINIIKSGPVPRSFNYPMEISRIFGKELHRDGRVNDCEKKNVNIFRSSYEYKKKHLPEG